MLTRVTFGLLMSATMAMMAFAAEEAVERISEAKAVFEEIMAAPDKGIPTSLLEKAHCIAIVPAVKRAGFVVGGQYGKGVAVCRAAGGTGWTGPSTVRSSSRWPARRDRVTRTGRRSRPRSRDHRLQFLSAPSSALRNQLMTARVAGTTPVTEGDTARLTFDTAQALVFDGIGRLAGRGRP